MEMTLLQALDYIARQHATDELQAAVDAIDRTRSRLTHIQEYAEDLLRHGVIHNSSDRFLIERIRDAATEALA